MDVTFLECQRYIILPPPNPWAHTPPSSKHRLLIAHTQLERNGKSADRLSHTSLLTGRVTGRFIKELWLCRSLRHFFFFFFKSWVAEKVWSFLRGDGDGDEGRRSVKYKPRHPTCHRYLLFPPVAFQAQLLRESWNTMACSAWPLLTVMMFIQWFSKIHWNVFFPVVLGRKMWQFGKRFAG